MIEHVCGPWCMDYCYTCKKHEPLTPDYFEACAECLHVFETEQDLVDAHNAMIRSMAVTHPGEKVNLTERPPYVKLGDKIYSCPLCLHDF